MKNLNAILTIAYRDFIKLMRDRMRLMASLIFPFVFVAVLGNSLQSNLSEGMGYSFLLFVFTGVLAQTLFQSTASGIISLIEDRQGDFSQEIFVSPVSRYAIIMGKILGETSVSLVQLLGIVVMGFLIGVPFELVPLLKLIAISPLICLFGGAFGVLVMANLGNQRSANQIFPFLIFPQFFLSGVFSPVKNLPLPLMVLSRISPMTYAVDFGRGVYYQGLSESSLVTLFPIWVNVAVMTVVFAVFLILGTWLFIRNERR